MAVLIEGLYKKYQDRPVLGGINLLVPSGTVGAVLGPNGAGKTTMVRIIATLERADAGRVIVDGTDVAVDPHEVRKKIGLSGQFAAVDDRLTGYENLSLVARLYGLSRRDAATRSRDLLDRLSLGEVADRPVGSYSGGMRRRIDLAGALIYNPPVIILDEPTTGLDPQSRMDIWDLVREQVAKGTTVVLTTQYLEEADQLADNILVMNRGEVVAFGTGDELKGAVGGDRLQIVLPDASSLELATTRLAGLGELLAPPDARLHRIEIRVLDGATDLATALRHLDGVPILEIGLTRATLDDVFLRLTGPASSREIGPIV